MSQLTTTHTVLGRHELLSLKKTVLMFLSINPTFVKLIMCHFY